MLKMDLEKNELWGDRQSTNETRDELKLRLFDDEGISALLKAESVKGKILVVTHSNVVKNLLLS